MNEYDSLRKQAEFYKKNYPPGTRIYLNHMDDPYAPIPSGTKGTVNFVDDMATIQMTWDNGRTLGLVPGVDSFRKLTDKELEEEQAKTAGSLRTPGQWCRHSAGHGALIPTSWCTRSAEDGALLPFSVVHGGRQLWCAAAMRGLSF